MPSKKLLMSRKIYWADYKKMKERVDPFLEWLATQMSADHKPRIHGLLARTHKAVGKLKTAMDRQSEPRMVYETFAEMKAEIENCPWRNREHLSCFSCECRAKDLNKKRPTRYYGYHSGDHNSQTDLRPHPEGGR